MMFTCGHCGATFEGRTRGGDTNKFCSRECGWKGSSRDRVYKTKAEQKRAQYERRAQRQCSAAWKPTEISCAQCSKAFTAKSKLTRYCSDMCRSKAHSIRKDVRNRIARLCVVCSASFTPEYGDKRRSVCSDECSRLSRRWARKHHSKARRYQCEREMFDPRKVFERDGYRCQLCMKMTKPAKGDGWQPLAPSLDHIVPLSKRGPHTMANTQCAHRICNSRKSDKPLGQMRLFG